MSRTLEKCRICLAEKDQVQSLYENFEQAGGTLNYLPNVIEELSGVQILVALEPLAIICTHCIHALLQAKATIAMCKNSSSRWSEALHLPKGSVEQQVRNNQNVESLVGENKEIETEPCQEQPQRKRGKNTAKCDEEAIGVRRKLRNRKAQETPTVAADANRQASHDHLTAEDSARKYVRTRNKNKDYFFHCDHCEYTTHFATYYRAHLEDVHDVRQPRIFKCPHCPKDFLEYRCLREHIAYVHEAQPKRLKFLCAECGRGFAKSSNLRYHQTTHLPKEQRASLPVVRCEHCGRDYSRHSIRMHILTVHAADRPHACTICQTSFAVAKSLQAHMRTCHPVEMYRCPCCEVGFRVRSVYEAHVQRGGCQKLGFNCEYCAWGFKTRTRLEAHNLNVHKHLLHLHNNTGEP